MALLQIAEPGMSADPHQHRLAVGIDLGTTNSLVATVKSAETVVLADHEGRKLLPSVVRYLSDGTTVVGHEARLAISEDSQNTIASVKRFMGRSSAEIKEASAFRTVLPSPMACCVFRPWQARKVRWKFPQKF